MALVATDGRFLQVNDSLCELVGYSADELQSRTFQDITHPDDLDADLEFVRRMLAGEIRTYQMEKRYFHRLGHVVWILLSVSLVREADGTPLTFISQIQDVTARKHAEKRLAEAEQRFRTLVEQLPLGTYIRPLDPSEPNIYASPQVEPMLGYPAEDWERDPGLLSRIVYPDDRERVLAEATRVRQTGQPMRSEYRYVARDGRVVWVQDETHAVCDEDGKPAYVQGFLLDITDRKQAQAERDQLRDELHHAQKLEAIGRLAGGVAHDFNNMLTAIKGYSQLLLEELEPGTTPYDDAVQIHRAAAQASMLPRQLLAFSRKQALEPGLVDVGLVVETTADLLRRLISESIALVTVRAAERAYAFVDPSQVEQVLVNLALNARDAMPDGGTLTITTSVLDVGEQVASKHEASPGAYVVLSVADTGVGMNANTRARAFEPFFTTKEAGQGSGLGLASVYGFVAQSRGFIRLESAPGAGSTFHIHLPRVPAPAVEAPVPAEPDATHAQASATVLLVEDEDVVRQLAVTLLERAGFRVLAAQGGAEALGIVQRGEPAIDVLVTDLVMPGLGGHELADHVLQLRPHLPVVYMSGYTEKDPTGGRTGDSATFLRKPFRPQELVEAVQATLGGAEHDPAREAAEAPQLTPRERQVLTFVAGGMTNERVAAALGISAETVQSHVRNAMGKLEAETRTQAVATALRQSLIS
jgi:PAS domain S-box-containing protein